MTGFTVVTLFVLAFIVLDVLALRFGIDSRSKDGRSNW